MAEETVQFTNNQAPLLSAGPFGGLDTTTSPLYVAPTNAVATQNVAINRNYGSYVTAQGRVGGTYVFPSTVDYVSIVPYTARTDGTTGGYIIGLCSGGSYVSSGGGNASNTFLVPNSFFQDYSAQNNPYVQVQDGNYVTAGAYIFPNTPMENPIVIFIDAFNNSSAGIGWNWGIQTPASGTAAAAGGAGNLSGAYYYAITYQNSTPPIPIESGSSPFTSPVTVTAQSVNLTGIPVSGDTQVTQKNIYRFGGTIGGTPLLVGSVGPAVTTFNDNLADGSITGQQLILRQDPAPFGGWQSICLHKNRMWGFGTAQQNSEGDPVVGPSDLWYSNYNLYTSFNSVTQVLSCDSDLSDLPVGLASLESVLVVFKSKTTWLCYGDTQNDFIVRKTFTIGCISKGSIAVGYGKVFWLSADGIYSYDGVNFPINISDGSIPQGGIRSEVLALIQGSAQARGFVTNRTYYISFNNGVTYGYDMASGGWTKYPYNSVYISAIPAHPQLGNNVVVGRNEANRSVVDSWFAAETDLGLPIGASWATGVSDSGAVGQTKQYRYIELEAPYQVGATALVEVIIDPPGTVGSTVLGPYTIKLDSGRLRHRQSLPPNTNGFEAQMIISTTSSSKVIIDKVVLYGYVKRQHTK